MICHKLKSRSDCDSYLGKRKNKYRDNTLENIIKLLQYLQNELFLFNRVATRNMCMRISPRNRKNKSSKCSISIYHDIKKDYYICSKERG